jgi:hypothetical protein
VGAPRGAEADGAENKLYKMIDAPPRPHSCSKKASAPRGNSFVDELHDADGDGAEQEDVYKAFLAQHEFSHEPRGEERRGE